MRLAATVARSASRVVRLCAGLPSAVSLVAASARAPQGEPLGGDDWGEPGGPGGVVVFEQHGGQALLHVPGDVVGEHADQHVRADPVASR